MEYVGPYRLERLLGKGGMGEVYLGHKANSTELFAVKLLKEKVEQNANQNERFHREIRALQKFSHPNIVSIVDSGLDIFPYYAMEFVDGPSVQSISSDQGAIPVHEAVSYAIQICRGLKNAHDMGIIHRDLKPANLLTDGKGGLKIADFGIARQWGESTVTHTGQVMGTPLYMSPEQAGGDSITIASDLFSLGAVLYSMITGRPPFNSPSTLKVLRMIATQPLTPPSVFTPGLPDSLDRLICQLMSKHPSHRPKSAHTVGRRLQVIQDELLQLAQASTGDPKPEPAPPVSTQPVSQTPDTVLNDSPVPVPNTILSDRDSAIETDKPHQQHARRCPVCFCRFLSFEQGVTRCPNCNRTVYDTGSDPGLTQDNAKVPLTEAEQITPMPATGLERLLHSELFRLQASVTLLFLVWGALFGQLYGLVDANEVTMSTGLWVTVIATTGLLLLITVLLYTAPYGFDIGSPKTIMVGLAVSLAVLVIAGYHYAWHVHPTSFMQIPDGMLETTLIGSLIGCVLATTIHSLFLFGIRVTRRRRGSGTGE